MTPTIQLSVNGTVIEVPAGSSVAAAVSRACLVFGRSAGGRTRSAFCGMGICFECRVTVDGREDQRACLILARPGMRVECER